MYSIGEFSKINRVTVKALRYYDELGLLKPCHVDIQSGYRYYSSEQMPLLHRIISLKQMGFSLEEIRSVLKSHVEIETLLLSKEDEVRRSIQSEQSKLDQIQAYLKSLKGEFDNMNDVIIKSLPKVIVASMRRTINSYNDFFNLMPNVMGPAMVKAGCVCAKPEYCFNIYHDGEYKETDIDVEMCEAVTEKKEDNEIICFKEIEAVPAAACLLHKGSYSSLGKSYARIMSWIEQNGYKIAANPRESYIDGCWNKEKEEDWLTELQFPVTK